MHRNLILILFILLIISPVSAEIKAYWPGFDNSISTSDVMDITNGPEGSVVFATSNGLCVFSKDSWTIFHSKAIDKRGYLQGIPLNDFVKCAEYDNSNNLWLGFSSGLQIYDGYTTPVTIRDSDKILSGCSINDLQSIGEQMWIATGNTGVYCYQNGEWKWFKPYSGSGLTATKISDMAVDYSTGTLVLASQNEGQYILLNDDSNNPHFKKIDDKSLSPDMREVRSGNKGGVYFFNRTDIAYYNRADGAVHVLNVKELSDFAYSISDLSLTKDGRIIIGTNFGFFAWKEGIITESLSTKDLISSQIKKVFVDSHGRWWFTNKYYAGYYTKPEFSPVISIEIA